jgi:hypothetical protein
VQQVPWSKELSCLLPVGVWREAVDAHFPNRAWITMSRQTLDELTRFKTRHALPTWDATLLALLSQDTVGAGDVADAGAEREDP